MLKFIDHYTSNGTKEDHFPTSKSEDSISENRLVFIGVIGGSVLLLFIIGIAIYCLCGRNYLKSRAVVQSETAVKYNYNDAEPAEHV